MQCNCGKHDYKSAIKKMQRNLENIIMITIENLQVNQVLPLNNP